MKHFFQSLRALTLRNTVNAWDNISRMTSQCLKQFRWSACATIFVLVPVPRGILYSRQISLTIRNQDGSECHLQSARKKGNCKLYKNIQKLPRIWISSTKFQIQEPLSSSYNRRAVNAYISSQKIKLMTNNNYYKRLLCGESLKNPSSQPHSVSFPTWQGLTWVPHRVLWWPLATYVFLVLMVTSST